MACRSYYKPGKRSVIAKTRMTRGQKRVRSAFNIAQRTYNGTYKRRAKRAVRNAVIRKGLKWGILGF